MNESKTVTINLKQLIADLIFAFNNKDEDIINDIKRNFEEVYNNQNKVMRKNIIKYLLGHKVVVDNVKLLKYFKTFSN